MDWIIGILIVAGIVAAILWIKKNKKSCTGDCSHCTGCTENNDVGKDIE